MTLQCVYDGTHFWCWCPDQAGILAGKALICTRCQAGVFEEQVGTNLLLTQAALARLQGKGAIKQGVVWPAVARP